MFSISLLTQFSGWVQAQNHLVRVRKHHTICPKVFFKTPGIGRNNMSENVLEMNQLSCKNTSFCHHKHSWRCLDFLSNLSGFFLGFRAVNGTTYTAGNLQRSC